MSKLTDKLDAWYDRQSWETLVLVGVYTVILTPTIIVLGFAWIING